MAATICVSIPSWLWKPPVKYAIRPLWSCVMYGTFLMWLNMWPLVNRIMAMSVTAAQRLRFWMTGWI